MEFITFLKEALVKQVEIVLNEVGTNCKAESLSAMEQGLQTMLHEVGLLALSGWLGKQEGQYPAASKACECGGQADYIRKREAVSITLHGKVRYR